MRHQLHTASSSALWLLWSCQKKETSFLPFSFSSSFFLFSECKIIYFRSCIWEHYKERILNDTLPLLCIFRAYNWKWIYSLWIFSFIEMDFCIPYILITVSLLPTPLSSSPPPLSSGSIPFLNILFYYSLDACPFSDEKQEGDFQSLKDTQMMCLALG